MKTSTINLIKIEPSEKMYLKNKSTGEVYSGCIYLAKSLSADNFEEITEDKYQKIVIEKRNAEAKKGEEQYVRTRK